MAHDERCPECKNRVGQLLRKLFGDVISNQRIELGTTPEDYSGKILNSLECIYSSVKKHRGYTDFVKASYVDVDFFVPNPGFVLEFDESQHFTEPRKITLQHYPPTLNTGFSRDRWMALCDQLNKYDNDPPYRDEQRAWYDTLRDFLPEIKGFKPTVRLYSRDMEWCSLNSGNESDLNQFKSFIATAKTEPFPIVVLCDPDPKLARIQISGSWGGDLNRAKSLLKEIVKKWPSGKHVEFLVTPAAFVRFYWPNHFPSPGDNLFPNKESVESLLKVAQEYCLNLIDEEIRTKLAEHADYLTVGIDSRDREENNQYEVEFVALIELKTNQYFWTGKSYPDTPQEHRLIRIVDLSTHFVNLPVGRVMVLGCHDLKLFSNRGRTVARNEWRMEAHREIDRLLELEQPEIVLQHPHTTDRSGSWIAEWNELVYRFPSIKRYISAGLYYHWGDPCRSILQDVLKNTKRGSSIDFIVASESGIPIEIKSPAQDGKKSNQNSTIGKHLPIVHASQRTNFSAVGTSFDKKINLIQGLKRTMSLKDLIRYSVTAWPKIENKPTKSVCYEFNDWPKTEEISVEINFWLGSFAEIGEIVQQEKEKIKGKMPGNPIIAWDTRWSLGWGRLKFIFPDKEDPEIFSTSMCILIEETKEIINNWLKSKNLGHY